ncbi:MAG: hypothetical protein ACUVS6_15560 [Anaerolineae bacterium]
MGQAIFALLVLWLVLRHYSQLFEARLRLGDGLQLDRVLDPVAEVVDVFQFIADGQANGGDTRFRPLTAAERLEGAKSISQ